MTIKPGVAHVAGLYPISATFLQDGVDAIKALGPNSKSIKLFFSSDYATKYPNQTGWGAVNNLVDLAASTPMAAVLGDAQLTDYFLNIFPWWSNWGTVSLTNYWVNSPVVDDASAAQAFSAVLALEKTAVQNLAAHLMTTYAGTGKTFVLQNWEGDWQLLNSYVTSDIPNPYWADRMRRVLQARYEGIQAAKAASSAVGVTVKFAVEVNRASNPGRRVHREILPLIGHDMVSWSAYESIVEGIQAGSITAACAVIDAGMRRFHAEIRKYSDRPIYVGEYGYPELEMNTTTYPPAALIQQVLDTGNELGWTHALYWQIYTNDESSPGVYRGFYLIKPDTTVSLAGAKHQLLFA